ncbi:S1 RNA-binding domain-containing protein [Candidatus Xianfuyuplasma coldseepsis]|uniref:DNA-binding protein n=1 Tax=Candidatus Xianfuyuplasma coldseepsis TaxID=2782163 RepID=A0A7L7KUG0_9MOLU|nr:S1-like domain-containing RNA-binding protein [Xianfuyuplasma coldseepsis]QMS85634.1 hypothetical protein G4Z02_07725 [Xianfuyuplasma coldseepsis]
MELKIGEYNELEVIRETDISYILSNGEEDVFLHKKEVTEPLEEHQVITVFLYYDNQKRITATMKQPLIDQRRPAFVEVVGVHPKLGVFLDIGLQKDLLLSIDDLPFVKKEWPTNGDVIFARMRSSKNQLTAKPISRFAIHDYLQPEESLKVGDSVEAINVYRAEEGNVFITRQGHSIFVYFKHVRKTYRLGEQETITITIDKGQYQYNGTTIEQKELMMDADGQRILDYLEEHDGVMPYTDKTSPQTIQLVFRMSKSAFKRALGSLYKAEKVILEKDQTRLL